MKTTMITSDVKTQIKTIAADGQPKPAARIAEILVSCGFVKNSGLAHGFALSVLDGPVREIECAQDELVNYIYS